MAQLVKPILSSSRGVYIEDNKLYYNGSQLLNANNSKLIDIINFEKSPINIRILNKILKAYGFNDLINSLVIRDYLDYNITFDIEPITFDDDFVTFDKGPHKLEKKLFSIGVGYSITHNISNVVPIISDDAPILDNSYLIAVGDQVSVLRGNGDKFTELKALFEDTLSELSSVFSRLDTVYDRIVDVQDKTDLPIQLVPDGHISDYVSFENNVTRSMTDVTVYEYSNINFNNMPIIGPASAGGDSPYLRFRVKKVKQVGTNITTSDGFEVPEFERRVKVGDILDIVIGYKQLAKGPSNITFDDSPVTLDDEEDLLWYDELSANELLFSSVTLNDSPIIFDGYKITYGEYPIHYLSTTLQVIESSLKLGNKFLIEINEDRLVVYSITPYITEYFIKSCRLIKRSVIC